MDRYNSYIHKSAERKSRIQNLHLAIHKNLQRTQYFWLQSIHQKSNINIGMASEVRALGVHSILWVFNPIPHKMLQCMHFLHSAGPETYDPITLESELLSENTWLWTVCTILANVTQRDSLSYKMINSSAGFKTFLHPHSMLSFFPHAGSPLALCYSACTPLLRLGSLKSSSSLGTNLSWALYKATWPSC